MTDNPLTINKKVELEKFNFSDPRAVIFDSQDDQISIVQFWRVLQKRRWLVLGSLIAILIVVTAVSLILPKDRGVVPNIWDNPL